MPLLTEGGDDNKAAAVGFKGRINPHHLNTPTVFNAALQKSEFWDGRVKNVEEQAGGPLQTDEIYEFFKSLNGELVDYKIDN